MAFAQKTASYDNERWLATRAHSLHARRLESDEWTSGGDGLSVPGGPALPPQVCSIVRSFARVLRFHTVSVWNNARASSGSRLRAQAVCFLQALLSRSVRLRAIPDLGYAGISPPVWANVLHTIFQTPSKRASDR